MRRLEHAGQARMPVRLNLYHKRRGNRLQKNGPALERGVTARQAILLLVFTLSGFTGLIYESIWTHYLKLFLGHAAYAQTLVLAIFMGGMAIGAWLVGRQSVRLRRLLLAYAIVELAIGILGLAFHRLFLNFLDWSFIDVIPSLQSSWTIQAFKWTAAAFLILPQSVLLGMTFPLISGGLIRSSPHRSGELLALLYFTNCLGAAVGVLFSGFFLIGKVGLPGTLLTAGILNILLAIAVWTLAGTGADTETPLTRDRAVAGGRTNTWLWAAAFLTGVASFLYEMAWIRMLSLVLGSSTHSFELMLAAFIFGLAFGGLWIRRRIDQLTDSVRFLSRVLLIMGVLAALTIPSYNFTFNVIAWAKSAFTPTESGYTGFNLLAQTLAMGLMVPVTFFAGMTLPLITRLLMEQRSGERAIGQVYAMNTLGAIVGVMAAIHVLMPTVGVKGTIIAGAATHLTLAVSGLLFSRGGLRGLRVQFGVVVASLSVAGIALGIHLDPRRMTSAVYRTGLAQRPADAEVIYLRDGKTATISLMRQGGVITIATNGKPDAAIEMSGGAPAKDEITMIMAGALPLSLHPAPRTVANIGVGSGLTSHVLLSTDAVSTLTSIEIEQFMVEAAHKAFMPRVSNLFEDKRSHLVVEDAKTFFAGAKTRFDVIVSEPSNPWVSGVATLFSDEFYGQVVRYLAPDGMLVQWLQIYETDISIVVSILKALSPHFADYQLYNVDDANILVVAQRGHAVPDPDPGIFDNAALREELRRGGIVNIEDLTSRRIGNKQLLDPFVMSHSAPANSDYFPYVDQNAMKFRFMNRNAVQLPSLTMLPVPFLELSLPSWRTRPPGNAPEFGLGYREDLSNRAGLIAASIASGDYSLLPDEVIMLIAALSPHDGDCQGAGQSDAWRVAVRDLSLQTTSMLPYADVEPLWKMITSSPCYATAVPDDVVWTDFYHAVARRDRPEISRLGIKLLEMPQLDTHRREFGYVLTATSAALYGMGRRDAVVQTINRWVADLSMPSDYILALQILAAAAFDG